jgi:hypothetical protein
VAGSGGRRSQPGGFSANGPGRGSIRPSARSSAEVVPDAALGAAAPATTTGFAALADSALISSMHRAALSISLCHRPKNLLTSVTARWTFSTPVTWRACHESRISSRRRCRTHSFLTSSTDFCASRSANSSYSRASFFASSPGPMARRQPSMSISMDVGPHQLVSARRRQGGIAVTGPSPHDRDHRDDSERKCDQADGEPRRGLQRRRRDEPRRAGEQPPACPAAEALKSPGQLGAAVGFCGPPTPCLRQPLWVDDDLGPPEAKPIIVLFIRHSRYFII